MMTSMNRPKLPVQDLDHLVRHRPGHRTEELSDLLRDEDDVENARVRRWRRSTHSEQSRQKERVVSDQY